MSTTDTAPKEVVKQALRAKDTFLAQSVLDDPASELSVNDTQSLQAQIYLAAGEPRKALEGLTAHLDGRQPSRGVGALLARSYLELERPADALAVLEPAFDDPEQGPGQQDVMLRIQALAALNDCKETVSAVNDARLLFPNSAKLTSRMLKALQQVGARDDMARIINGTPPGEIPGAALKAFVGDCLGHGEATLLQKFLSAAAPDIQQRSEIFFRLCIRNAETPAARDTMVKTVVELIGDMRSSVEIYQLGRDLYLGGFDAEGDKAVAHLQKLSERQRAELLAPQPPDDIPVQRLEHIMDWLEIPDDQRPEWMKQFAIGRAEKANRKCLLAADPAYQAAFKQSLVPADLRPFEEIVKQQKPAIMATVHAGVMMGSLQHLETHNIPISILGGCPVLRRVLSGGERLNAIATDETPVRTAGRLIKHIRSGHIVGLAADGRHGVDLVHFHHRGIDFELAGSIPQMAFRYGVPIIWMATFWQDDKIVCECFEGPAPSKDEPFVAFRERWFLFLMDRLHAISSEDPRNARQMPKAQIAV